MGSSNLTLIFGACFEAVLKPAVCNNSGITIAGCGQPASGSGWQVWRSSAHDSTMDIRIMVVQKDTNTIAVLKKFRYHRHIGGEGNYSSELGGFLYSQIVRRARRAENRLVGGVFQ
jgi:hypothetical protein